LFFARETPASANARRAAAAQNVEFPKIIARHASYSGDGKQ
jgi:hypothetical protein